MTVGLSFPAKKEPGGVYLLDPIEALCIEVRERQWEGIFLTDGDGTFWQPNSMDAMYRRLCGAERIDRYDQEFFQFHARSQQWHMQAQLRDLFTENKLHAMLEWLDQNINLTPDASEFVSELAKAHYGVVIVSNNIDLFIRQILRCHRLDLPFLSNYVSSASGDLVTIHGEDGVNKDRLLKSLVDYGIKLLGFAGDSESDKAPAKLAAQHGLPVACFGEPTGQGDLHTWCVQQGIPATRVQGWDQVLQMISLGKEEAS